MMSDPIVVSNLLQGAMTQADLMLLFPTRISASRLGVSHTHARGLLGAAEERAGTWGIDWCTAVRHPQLVNGRFNSCAHNLSDCWVVWHSDCEFGVHYV